VQRWILRFLEIPEWLNENLPPSTFAKGTDINQGTWTNQTPNTRGSDPTSDFTPEADPYKRSEDYPDSLVHCTTLAWDQYVDEHVNRHALLSRRAAGNGVPLNESELAEISAAQETCVAYARAMLVRLTLRRCMTSRIPFNGRPIIPLPPMNITTHRIAQPNETEANGEPLESLILNQRFLNEPYASMMKLVGSSSVKFGNPTFKSRWRLIAMSALSPLNGVMAAAVLVKIPAAKGAADPKGKAPAGKGKEKQGDPHAVAAPPLGRFKSTTLWALPKGKVDHGKPDLERLRELCEIFISAFPNNAKKHIPRTRREIKVMKPDNLEKVCYCQGSLPRCPLLTASLGSPVRGS